MKPGICFANGIAISPRQRALSRRQFFGAAAAATGAAVGAPLLLPRLALADEDDHHAVTSPPRPIPGGHPARTTRQPDPVPPIPTRSRRRAVVNHRLARRWGNRQHPRHHQPLRGKVQGRDRHHQMEWPRARLHLPFRQLEDQLRGDWSREQRSLLRLSEQRTRGGAVRARVRLAVVMQDGGAYRAHP
jgi:hypothetical protein